jgi:CheY-like chemotaxis protein
MSERKKILVVDDEPTLALLVKMRLESHGFSVSIALNGLQALKAIEKSKPDLILLDIVMPEMRGDELCKQLRQEESTRTLPIVIITASQHGELADQCLDFGANGVIMKPFDSQTLLSEIHRHIS